MAVELIHCNCIDHKNSLYQMEFWATSLSDCVAPSGMNMCGGSKAIITSANSVKHYIYNSSNNSWKEDAYGIVSAEM